jgi:precorrin-3B synthase
MSAPVIQGWCPGALRPMMSGDGLVARVRPHSGRLTPTEVRGIADLARRHGNGLIDLSGRANVQLRGVTAKTHPALIDGLSALGLIDPSAGAEARRNIVVSPFWEAGDGTTEIAAELERLLTSPRAPDLPGKFGFSIDGGRRPTVLGDVFADVRIARHSSGWLVYPDSFVTGAVIDTPVAAAKAAMELARWFVDAGGVKDGRGRMANLWKGDTTRDRNGRLPLRFKTGGAGAATSPDLTVGVCPQGFLAGFAFGQCDAETFGALADLGPIRVTPWRMVLIEGLRRAPSLPGLITEPRDPLLNVTACTGAPGCPQALGATRALARRLAPLVPQGQRLHVSGCAKGCAHPGPAEATLVASSADSYDLMLNDTAAGQPARTDLGPVALTASVLFPTG